MCADAPIVKVITGINPNVYKEYRTWKHIKERCNNKKCKAYKHYGGRGIKVCRRWENSYDYFLSDMGRAPSPAHSIERIDNNKGYSPDNCKWATLKEQMNNKRSNWVIEVFGENKTFAQWCELYNINPTTVRNRLFRKPGWDIERALTTPAKARVNNDKSALLYTGHADWRQCIFCKQYSPPKDLVFGNQCKEIYHQICRYNYNLQRIQNRDVQEILRKRSEQALKDCGHADWVRCQFCRIYAPLNENGMMRNKQLSTFHKACRNQYAGKKRRERKLRDKEKLLCLT